MAEPEPQRSKSKSSSGSSSSSSSSPTSTVPVPHQTSLSSILSHNFIYIEEEDNWSQAWCIVICCCLVNILVMGFLKTMGILIIEIRESFHATQSDVSALVSITSALNSAAGPLACYLVLKFTARSIAFMGTCLVSLGLMISWFAPNITFLYFSIGVLVGLGSGFTYSPGIILVGNYFQRNRGMANGVVVSGNPVGGMIMPYILNFLVHYLECRGALLILGGLMMNAVICTLSYKPYKVPRKVKRRLGSKALGRPKKKASKKSVTAEDSSVTILHKDTDDSSGPEEFTVEEDNAIRRKTSKDSTGSLVVYKVNENYGQSGRRSASPHQVPSKPPYWEETTKMKLGKFSGQSVQSKISQTEIGKKVEKDEVVVHTFGSSSKKAKGTRAGPGLVVPSGKFGSVSNGVESAVIQTPPSSPRPRTDSGFLLSSEVGSQTMKPSGMESSLRNRRMTKNEIQGLGWAKQQPPGLSTNTLPLPPYILSLDHSCVIIWSTDNLTKGQPHPLRISEEPPGQPPDSGEGDLASLELETKPKKASRCTRLCNWLKKSPLSNTTYLILLLSNATTAIATGNVLLLVPTLGEHRGLTKAETSTVYMIISLSDLCSRLIGAFLFDRRFISPKMVFASGLVFAGVASFCIGMADTLLLFCIFGAMFGLSCGLHIGVYGALLAEVVGIPLLPQGYAFCMIVNGILQFSFINISGYILSKDQEAYEGLYFFYGVVLIIGGCIWLIPFIIAKYKDCKKSSEARTNTQKLKDQQAGRSNSFLGSGITGLSHLSMF